MRICYSAEDAPRLAAKTFLAARIRNPPKLLVSERLPGVTSRPFFFSGPLVPNLLLMREPLRGSPEKKNYYISSPDPRWGQRRGDLQARSLRERITLVRDPLFLGPPDFSHNGHDQRYKPYGICPRAYRCPFHLVRSTANRKYVRFSSSDAMR
jgi:hypothetical protein